MVARIYQPARTATQSGRAKTRRWLLELEPTARREADPLCGWLGSDDTDQQVQLWFPSKEAAVAYARRRGIVRGTDGEAGCTVVKANRPPGRSHESTR